jgi:hypothetical protein
MLYTYRHPASLIFLVYIFPMSPIPMIPTTASPILPLEACMPHQANDDQIYRGAVSRSEVGAEHRGICLILANERVGEKWKDETVCSEDLDLASLGILGPPILPRTFRLQLEICARPTSIFRQAFRQHHKITTARWLPRRKSSAQRKRTSPSVRKSEKVCIRRQPPSIEQPY